MERMRPIEEKGEMILEFLLTHKKNPGGSAAEATGAKGSGKTSLFLHIAEIFTKRYPKELLFWRDSIETPLQFVRYPKWDIFVEEGFKFTIRDKNDGGRIVDIPYKMFNSLPMISYDQQKLDSDADFFKMNQAQIQIQNDIFKDLCKDARGGRLSVVFFKRENSWIDFLRYLRGRPDWQTLFLDEYEDIFPYYNTGDRWRQIEWTKNNLKQVRKGLVNVWTNTQTRTDVDWRIRKKMDVWIYLFGAVPDNDSPLVRQAVSSISPGQGYLDWGRSQYGKMKFSPYPLHEDIFWEARWS